ncbi:MAG: hypothetical protein B6241_04345 [Spirochaetaceae bacterium 4572_59]|nr:MAG: hypothetical protein B6241_04345 [Spirochaetaceae bacterium 4572_59]
MARTNYSYEKRQKELKKIKKRQEKLKKKEVKNTFPEGMEEGQDEILNEASEGTADTEETVKTEENPSTES